MSWSRFSVDITDMRRSRQSGSHVRLTSVRAGSEHHLTVPRHRSLRVGTLAAILDDAAYLDRDRDEVAEQLFG